MFTYSTLSKTIEISSITEDDIVNGVYGVKSKKGYTKYKSRMGTAHALTLHRVESPASTSSASSRTSGGDGKTYLTPSQKAYS